MGLSRNVQYDCPRCKDPIQTVMHHSYVIEDEEALRALYEQRFHVVTCPRCKETWHFEADFLVTNAARDMFVQVICKDDKVAEMRQTFEEMVGGKGFFVRIVANRSDMVEKVKIWKAGLDDVALEVLKHFLRIQIRDLEGKTNRYFEGLHEGEVVFSIREPGQPTKVMKIPMTVYENVQRDLGTRRYKLEMEVDERLARRLLDQKRAATPQA